MPELGDVARREIWREAMSDMSTERESCSITKAELRAAVDALDVWFNANAAIINAAIPQPARGALNNRQKARLLSLVIRRRYIDGA